MQNIVWTLSSLLEVERGDLEKSFEEVGKRVRVKIYCTSEKDEGRSKGC